MHLREHRGRLGLDAAVGGARGVRATEHADVVEPALDDAGESKLGLGLGLGIGLGLGLGIGFGLGLF